MQDVKFTKTPLSLFRLIAIQVLYWSFFLFLIPQFLIQLVIQFRIIPYASLGSDIQWFTYLICAVIAYLLAYPLFKKERKLSLKKMVVTIVSCIFIMYFFNILFNIFMQLLDGPSTSNNQQALTSQVANNVYMYTIMTCVFAPFLEEIVFRGGIFRTLRTKWGFILAAIISSFLFGFVHIASSLRIGDFQDVIYIFLYSGLGFCFCFAYEYNKSIAACIILHGLYNMVGMLPFLIG